MKKIYLIVVALCMLFALSACGRSISTPTETDFFSFCGAEDFAKNFDTNRPRSLSYTFNGEASGEPVVLTDKDDITAVYEALAAISVSSKANTLSTDNEHIFEFALQDGKSILFCFNGHNLEHGGEAYTLKNDGTLWNLVSRITE